MQRLIFSSLFAIFIFSSFFSFIPPTHAQYSTELDRQLQATAGEEGAGFQEPADPRAVAGRIIKTLLSFLGIIILSYTVYGGYLMMTAAGNSDQFTTGRKTVTHGIVGLLVILSAYSITHFATKFATGDSARQGTFIEIEQESNPNRDPLNYGTSPDAFSPLPQGAQGNRGVYVR